MDDDGFLKITDRKKDLIITAGGENVPPAIIEGLLKHIDLVEGAAVYGDMQKFLVAIVTLDRLFCFKEAKKQCDLDTKEVQVLADSKAFQELMWAKVEAQLNAVLPRVQTIKRVKILCEEWSDAGDSPEMTPTQKLKRRPVYTKYMRQIHELYAESWNGDPPQFS